jgi:two-component system sensor histidine kinase BaeS
MVDARRRGDEVRRHLVADVAHELRTPVTVLRASCEELVDGLAEPTPDRLASLHDEVLRLGRVVEDLEALSSAEAAALRLETAPVDLAGVVGGVVEALAARFEDAGLVLEVRLDPVVVEGDAARLHQVTVNLLTNALKFTSPGGSVGVAVAASERWGELVVSDDGPGIPGDELPHVFERFWRGRAARVQGGSGIGLAIVAELVRAHLGRVEVDSRSGEGARVRVLIPRPLPNRDTAPGGRRSTTPCNTNGCRRQ